MKLFSIASGSSGNSIFVGTEQTCVLVDAGISGKRIEAGLQEIGHTGSDLQGILVTHEHSDHVAGLGVLARRCQVPIYATAGTIRQLRRQGTLGDIPEELYMEISPDTEIEIGDLRVRPFAISHDAVEPVGYRLESGKKSAAIATDMGIYSDYIVRALTGLDALLLEANHDVRMLEVGRYPYPLKQRILGERGHLSNEASGRLLGEVLHDDMKHIVLGHLSKENNYPALAFETVCAEVTMGDNPYKAKDFAITVAHRDRPGDLIEF